MKLSTAIFDLDGTLIDSEDQWNQAFTKVLVNLGAKDVGNNPTEFGLPLEDNWRKLLEKYNINTDKSMKELRRLTYYAYSKILSEVRMKDGASDFLGRLENRGIKLALATNCERWIVEEIFAIFDIEKFFDAVVTGEEVSRRKPDPEMFLVAADKLDTDPGECLVIEDSLSGIKAAAGAGMKYININDTKGFSEITTGLIDSL